MEDLEELTTPGKPDEEEYSDDIERPQLATSAAKKGLQVADDSVDYFFAIGHFTDRLPEEMQVCFVIIQ